MGKYINGIGTSFTEKVQNLKSNHQGIVIDPPVSLIPDLVCVADNGLFAAAAYCYDQRVFQKFSYNDGRRKCWLIVPNANELTK